MRVVHLADIQIRAHSRHDEYRKSFDILDKSLKEKRLEKDIDAIVVAGDILHHKTVLSPEAVDVCVDFFSMLSEHSPQVNIILGNHDLAMNNASRINSLAPIVKALEKKANYEGYMYPGMCNLLDKSQFLPNGHECYWVIMSINDGPKEWDKAKKQAIEAKKKHNLPIIALWHGTINGVTLDNGTSIESPHNLSMFDGCDYVMLGDIHKTQILDKERRIAYPGSYPKQSYGESLSGGYFLWDIEDRNNHNLEFVELQTVCPFYTSSASNVLNQNFKKHSRIRIECDGLNDIEKKELTGQVRQKFEPIEIKIVDKTSKTAKIADAIQVDDIRTISKQEELLRDYAADKGLSETQMRKLFELNKKVNDTLPTDDVVRHARYKLKHLDFDNLFSFGEKNSIDFTKLKGLIGVQGKNKAGKSSVVVDVPLYTMYNKISKSVQRNQDYVNHNKGWARSALTVELNGKDYVIERQTEVQNVKKRNGTIESKSSTKVQFTYDSKNLNALERADTDKEIRKVFGTAEDFMRTSVAPQFELLGFVQDKASDRKKTIGRYFDLDLFEHKHKYANEEFKFLKREISRLEDKDYNAEIKKQRGLYEEHIKLQSVFEKKEAETQQEYNDLRNQQRLLEEKKDNTAGQQALDNLQWNYTVCNKEFNRLKTLLNDFKKYKCVTNKDCCMRDTLYKTFDEYRSKLKESEDLCFKLEELKKNVERKKQEINKDIEHKKQIFREKILSVVNEQNKLRSSAQESFRMATLAEAQIKNLEKERSKFELLRDEYAVSQIFTHAMSKDGISFDIIKSNLRVINNAIASLLDNNMEFKIWLADEDKEIKVYFQESQDKLREIEICSGMEKSIAAIAIRAALISVTSLPVSNVFILDEALTALDAEHLSAMEHILNSLKSMFDTILLISHDDFVKDLCDDVLIVEKNKQGYSEITQGA